jgi:nicotinate-nucleotide pyrophosphorylase (carboxylating)
MGVVTGDIRVLLSGERTALNYLQRMSGIATYTHKVAGLLAGSKIQLLDTRKTTPNNRIFEKYAVRVGGGHNHRYNLSDCAMLKDTHLDAYGSMTGAVNALREKMGHTVKIEVEVGNLEELKEALTLGVEIIMLDNMTNEDMAKAVEMTNGKALLEASGNVTSETIRAIAETGVDIISIGAITHSVKAFDISMKIEK